MKICVPEHILAIKPYTPGKNPNEIKKEMGGPDAVKMASNENPLGMSPDVRDAVSRSLATVNRYPDGHGDELRTCIARKNNVDMENVVLGNGSDDIIYMMARAFLKENDEVAIPFPSFSMYEIAVKSSGAIPVFAPLKSYSLDPDAIIKAVTPKTRMVFICNPNNPTGSILVKEQFDALLDRIAPDIPIVVDEAYIEFVRNADCMKGIDYIKSKNPVVVLRTFSKIYGLAGLRIGYGIMPVEISGILNRIRAPFNTNSLAQVAACAALNDDNFANQTKKLAHDGLDFLYAAFDAMGIKYIKSEANFVLIHLGDSCEAVFDMLLSEGFIARSMASSGLPGHMRVSIGTRAENEAFANALGKILKKI